MWVIRAGDQDRLVPRFVDQGVIGVGFGHVPDAEILTRTEIRRFLTDGQPTAALDAQEAAMSAFVRELQVGDSVLMPDPLCDEVVVGTVTGRYQFDDDATDPSSGTTARWTGWPATRSPTSLLRSAAPPDRSPCLPSTATPSGRPTWRRCETAPSAGTRRTGRPQPSELRPGGDRRAPPAPGW